MIYIHKEKKANYRDVERMIAESSKDNKYMHFQICSLRGTKNYDKELSFLAEDNGIVVGYAAIVKAEMHYGDETSSILLMLSPIVKSEYQNQGVAKLLLKNILEEAKYLGYSQVYLFKKDAEKVECPFVLLENVTLSDEQMAVINFSKDVQNVSKGTIELPSVFRDEIDENLFNLYHQKIFQMEEEHHNVNRRLTKTAFLLALLFFIIAIVLTILRVKNIVAPAIGLGSLIIAIGGCLGSIGLSNFVTDKKGMGWVAVSLAAIVMILGVFILLN